jgi:hypothetical protein
MFVVRFKVSGENGEWCMNTDNNDEIIDAICDEYGVGEDAVEIISIIEQ